ncbi:MAG: helix-turn-helix transcriptional regulator [Dysgonamonadaceae bacterium]
MKMRNVSKYDFFKTKYGSELLIDVVELKDIKKYLLKKSLHVLSYYDITLITEGEGFFRIDDTNHHAKAMDVFFSFPNQLREWDTENLGNGYALIFEEEFLLSFFNDPHFIHHISYFKKNRSSVMLSLSPVEFEHMHALIRQIKHEIAGCIIKNKHILRALLYQALMYLDRAFTEQNNVSSTSDRNTYVEGFLRLVYSDFQKKHSVQYYAEKLYITPNYLNELVKKETGISAKQMIQNKLIAEAKKYLLYSNRTIVEISESLSFETPSYFIRFFRKYVGSTPLQFRKAEKP